MPTVTGSIPGWRVGVLVVGQPMSALLPSLTKSSNLSLIKHCCQVIGFLSGAPPRNSDPRDVVLLGIQR